MRGWERSQRLGQNFEAPGVLLDEYDLRQVLDWVLLKAALKSPYKRLKCLYYVQTITSAMHSCRKRFYGDSGFLDKLDGLGSEQFHFAIAELAQARCSDKQHGRGSQCRTARVHHLSIAGSNANLLLVA